MKRKKGKNFYISCQNVKINNLTRAVNIMKKLNDGKYQKQIAEELDISRQSVNYYIRKFEACKAIITRDMGTHKEYVVTDEGKQLFAKMLRVKEDVKTFSSGIDRLTRIHNVELSIPIKRNSNTADFTSEPEYRENKLNNWSQHIFELKDPHPMTIKVNKQSIIAHIHRLETSEIRISEPLSRMVNMILNHIKDYFFRNHNIDLDIENYKHNKQEFATYMPEYDDVIPQGTNIRVNLGRKAKSLKDMNKEAWASMDRSTERGIEFESNDLTYQENLLLMPEIVAKLDKENRQIKEGINQLMNISRKMAERASMDSVMLYNMNKSKGEE